MISIDVNTNKQCCIPYHTIYIYIYVYICCTLVACMHHHVCDAAMDGQEPSSSSAGPAPGLGGGEATAAAAKPSPKKKVKKKSGPPGTGYKKWRGALDCSAQPALHVCVAFHSLRLHIHASCTGGTGGRSRCRRLSRGGGCRGSSTSGRAGGDGGGGDATPLPPLAAAALQRLSHAPRRVRLGQSLFSRTTNFFIYIYTHTYIHIYRLFAFKEQIIYIYIWGWPLTFLD